MQEGKPENPGKPTDPRKAWTGNQMHISAGTENRTRDSLFKAKKLSVNTCQTNYMILGTPQ